MDLIQSLRTVWRVLLAFTIFSFASGSSASDEPMPDTSAEVIIGQPLHQALISACITREQAEAVLKIHSEKGLEEAERAFREANCFVFFVNLIPRSLVSSKRIGNQTLSIVEIVVQTGPFSQHTIYMITANPVILGTRI